MSQVFLTLQKIANGQISVTDATSDPDRVMQGIPLESDGAVAADYTGAIVTYSQGLPITAEGRIAAATAGASYVSNGLFFTDAGRVVLPPALPFVPGTDTGFNPATLFASGEEGAYFDASDSATLFQDAAGTTAVTTVGDPVGLMLDQSQGTTTLTDNLGPELWDETDTPTITQDGTSDGAYDGAGRFTNSGGSTLAFRPLFDFGNAATTGRFYKIDLDFTVANDVVRLIMQFGNINFYQESNTTPVGSYSVSTIVKAISTEGFSVLTNGATAYDFTITNLSIKELPGNHATQSTSTARPLWARVPEGGRRNLLTYTEELGNAVWDDASVTSSSGKEVLFTGSGAASVTQIVNVGATDGEQFTVRVGLREIAGSAQYTIALQERNNSSFLGVINSDANNNLSAGVNYFTVTGTGSNASGNSISLAIIRPGTDAADGDTIEIVDVQAERGATATAYQKVTADYDITEAGVADKYGLLFDGVDDQLKTPSIDLTADSGITLGLAISGEGNGAFPIEFGSSGNNGSIDIRTLFNGTGWGSTPQGTTSRNMSVTTSQTSPAGAISRADISAPSYDFTVNGVSASGANSLGTGGFADSPLSIGSLQSGSSPSSGIISAAFVIGRSIDNTEKSDLLGLLQDKAGVA